MPFRFANVAGRAALVADERLFDLETLSDGSVPADPMAALAQPAELARLNETLATAAPSGALADAKLGPPVPSPRNSYGIGLNYRDHAAEANLEVPDDPLVFSKFPSCIVGPTADVELRSDRVDYEGELVVVIGPGGKDIPHERAWQHVLGLTVGQDISDRRAQMMSKPPHFALGKSFDTFGPIGPLLVSPDALGNPADLLLQTYVNDDRRQNAQTSSLIFDIPTLVSFLSSITTLQTGDIIFTGTPEGVGFKSRQYLVDGDVITTTIEGIGSLRNVCRRVSDWRQK